MKLEKRNKKEELIKMSESFAYLKINLLDNAVDQFWKTNLDHFIFKEKSTDIELIGDNGFILSNNNNSSFKVIFNPTIVSPRKISLVLTNLENHLSNSFVIDFMDSNRNMVRIIENACYKSFKGNSIRRKKIDTVYINDKKYYQRKVECFVQDLLDCENNYSQESIKIYPNLDDCYVKSDILVGTNDTETTTAKFEKYDGNIIKSITSYEFDEELKKKKANKFKVLKKSA